MIVNQGSWGVLTHDYPDTETPPPASHCQGGFPNVSILGQKACLFPARGNLIYGNTFIHVGYFGNPSNSDLGTVGLLAKSPDPRNCFYRNRAFSTKGKAIALTSSPAHIELPSKDGPSCGRRGTWNDGTLFVQLACSSIGLLCPSNAHYPQQTKLTIVPLPKLATMPSPCSGLPANAFCKP
jgi:hypothetical protein